MIFSKQLLKLKTTFRTLFTIILICGLAFLTASIIQKKIIPSSLRVYATHISSCAICNLGEEQCVNEGGSYVKQKCQEHELSTGRWQWCWLPTGETCTPDLTPAPESGQVSCRVTSESYPKLKIEVTNTSNVAVPYNVNRCTCPAGELPCDTCGYDQSGVGANSTSIEEMDAPVCGSAQLDVSPIHDEFSPCVILYEGTQGPCTTPTPIPVQPVSCSNLSEAQTTFENGEEFHTWAIGNPVMTIERTVPPGGSLGPTISPGQHLNLGNFSLKFNYQGSSDTQNMDFYSPVQPLHTYAPQSTQPFTLTGWVYVESTTAGRGLHACVTQWNNWSSGTWLGANCAAIDTGKLNQWQPFTITAPTATTTFTNANDTMIEFYTSPIDSGDITFYADNLCTNPVISVTPTPAARCEGLSFDPAADSYPVGTGINLTCSADSSFDHANFRYRVDPDSAFTDIGSATPSAGATTATFADFTITRAGIHIVQCQICTTSSDTGGCTTWGEAGIAP